MKFRLASGMWSDNQSSIAIASNPVLHQRTKHIAIKYQYVNECVKNGCIVIEYIRSKDNIADMFTKSVGPIIFQAHYPFVMGWLEIPRVSLVVETLEEEYLPCPNCSTGYCKREDKNL